MTAIAGTLDLIAELDGSLQLADCTAAHMWRGLGRVRVGCRFRAGSDFITAMGLEEAWGTLSAVVGDGAVVSLTASAGVRLWQTLENWARAEDPAAAALTFGAEDGEPTDSPRLDAELAAAAIDWAARYRGAFMAVGDTIETVTPLGDMAWSLVDPFSDQTTGSVIAARGAFWALTVDPEPIDPVAELWGSPDGIDWEMVAESPTPGWWSPLGFADRLVVTSSGSDAPLLREWNGLWQSTT